MHEDDSAHAEIDPVLFNSAEEMLGVTLAQKLDRLGIDSDDLVLGEYQDIDEMKYAADFEGVDFLVVDSISEMDPGAGQVEALRSYCKDKSIGLWLIAHELKAGGEYKGPSNLGHGTDVVARVTEDGEFVASKNRYAQTGESTSVPFSADDLGAAASSGDGVDTRENPELSVRKHTDHGDNEPGRLDQAWNGETIDVPARSICIHGDGPNPVELLTAMHDAADDHGIELAALDTLA